MTHIHEHQIAIAFNDPKNITVGKARLIWARSTADKPEGWVLPGGRRTQEFVDAHAVACRMDDMCSGVTA